MRFLEVKGFIITTSHWFIHCLVQHSAAAEKKFSAQIGWDSCGCYAGHVANPVTLNCECYLNRSLVVKFTQCLWRLDRDFPEKQTKKLGKAFFFFVLGNTLWNKKEKIALTMTLCCWGMLSILEKQDDNRILVQWTLPVDPILFLKLFLIRSCWCCAWVQCLRSHGYIFHKLLSNC